MILLFGQICCGLCIYRRQYGLHVCCGNDDDDVTASARQGRRKTHVVVAAQYNQAFDDSALCPAVITDQTSSPAKENGIAATAAAQASASEHADREVDPTVANAEGSDEVLQDITVTPGAGADTEDAENVNQTRANVADDDIMSDQTFADTNPSSDDCVRNTAETPMTDRSAVTDDHAGNALEPEVVFVRTPLPETENNRRTKTAPAHRRCRSMGAAVNDNVSCDKAVGVDEGDLAVEPEEEVVTDNETNTLSEGTTDEESREQRVEERNDEKDTEDTARDAVSAGESNVEDPRMLGNLVLDLDELGIINTVDVKQEEVSRSCYVQQFLARDSIYAIVRYMLSPVRPSVCQSITRLAQSKTVEVRIMQLSPQSSPMTLVSSRLTSPRYSKGNVGSGVPNERDVAKIRNFQPINRRISETVQDMAKV